MSIFARTRPPVKPSRHTPRPDRPFAEGIFPSHEPRRMPYTAADLQWAAETSPFANERYDVLIPGMALRSVGVAPDPIGTPWQEAAARAASRSVVTIAAERSNAPGGRSGARPWTGLLSSRRPSRIRLDVSSILAAIAAHVNCPAPGIGRRVRLARREGRRRCSGRSRPAPLTARSIASIRFRASVARGLPGYSSKNCRYLSADLASPGADTFSQFSASLKDASALACSRTPVSSVNLVASPRLASISTVQVPTNTDQGMTDRALKRI